MNETNLCFFCEWHEMARNAIRCAHNVISLSLGEKPQQLAFPHRAAQVGHGLSLSLSRALTRGTAA
jgi:hypothetical protein